MKKIHFLIVIFVLFISTRLLFANNDSDIIVDFDISQSSEIIIKIKNISNKKLNLEHPDKQMALAFIVMNDAGNLIQPDGIAKVSPREQPITLKPGQIFEYLLSKQLFDLAKEKELSLPFLTGTALFGYTLEKGKTYRIIVVYRPYGKEKEGICSKEKIIKIK